MKQKKIFTLLALIVVLGVVWVCATFYSTLVKSVWTRVDVDSEQQKEERKVDIYKPALAYEEMVIEAVDAAEKSVVSISASKNIPLLDDCVQNPFGNLPPELQQMLGDQFQIKTKCDNGKTQKKETSGGSGFVISDDGLIITNKHVVADASADYTVFTNDGKKYPAKVVAKDPVNDIAVLKVDVKLPAAKIGDSDSIKLGQTAIAIGNALGEYRNTVSVGVVSGLSRSVTAGSASFGVETIDGVIQTDAAINLGNSGGPLLNLRGEVIGINTAIASGAQNIGFAIPINRAKRAINSVKATGDIKVPYVGVRFVMITEEMAKKQNLVITEGALVRGDAGGPAIMKNSPAEKAGVKAEDIITYVNNEKIADGAMLSTLIQKYNVGDTVELTIVRDKETIKLKVILEERPRDSY